MIKLNKAAAGLAIALAALTAPGHAAQSNAPVVVEGQILPTITVSYADLNLANPAGMARLQTRIRNAAEQLCIDHGVRSLQASMASRACFNQAMAGAEQQIAFAARGGGNQLAGRSQIIVALR